MKGKELFLFSILALLIATPLITSASFGLNSKTTPKVNGRMQTLIVQDVDSNIIRSTLFYSVNGTSAQQGFWCDLMNVNCEIRSMSFKTPDGVSGGFRWGTTTNRWEFLNPISVNTMLKVNANTTSVTCSATNEGGIYYDGTVKKHYGCDGTNWNALY